MVALKRAGWLLRKFLSLGSLLGFLGQENSLDVGEDSTLGNGDSSQQLVQLLIIADGELEVTGDDPGLLVVTGSIASQLKNLSCEILHDGSHVNRCSSSHTLSIVSLAEQTMDTSDRELESSTAGPGLCLSLDLSSFTTSRHVVVIGVELRLAMAQSLGSTLLNTLWLSSRWRHVGTPSQQQAVTLPPPMGARHGVTGWDTTPA